MSQPSDAQLRDWGRLMDTTKWGRLAESLIDYRRREIPTINSAVLEPVPAVIVNDGYPNGGEGGGSGQTIRVDGELIPVTSVEAAALSKAVDAFHDSVLFGVDFFQQAVASRNAVENRLRLIDQLTPDHPKTRSICDDCQVAGLVDPHVNAPEHYGTVGGILDRNADLCRMHIDFVYTRHRRATAEETRHKDSRGTWPPSRVDPKAKTA
jgi:hypothetical protein